MAGHYDFSTLKRTLVHFITGKALAAVCSIGATLLLARALPKSDFAAFIIFEATINLTGIALSFGISQQVLLRYIPELRVKNNGLALYRLIHRALLARAWIFALACLVLALLGPWLGRWFGFDHVSDIFSMYLIAGWGNLMLHPVFACMESLLWQKTTQYVIAATAAGRLILLFAYYMQGQLDFRQVVLIEIVYQVMTFLLLLAGYWLNQQRDPHRHAGDPDWFDANRQRIIRYSRMSYGFSLSSLLTGSQPNRMAAGRFLPSGAIGDYGFADSLTGIFGRFLPSTLLQGFIRPVYFARYSETNQLRHIERLGNLILRVNMVLMSQAALLLLMFGEPLIDAVTAGKYGTTVNLVVAMLGILVLGGLLNHFTLLCQTLEKNVPLIYSNLLISASIVLSFPLFPVIGAWAIVVANVCGLAMAMLFIRFWLARSGTVTKFDFVLIFRILTAFVVPWLVGLILQQHYGVTMGGIIGWVLSILFLAVWWPFTQEEVDSLRRILLRRQSSTT